jgi:hypothetical protein
MYLRCQTPRRALVFPALDTYPSPAPKHGKAEPSARPYHRCTHVRLAPSPRAAWAAAARAEVDHEGELVPLPTLSPEQRAAALEKAAEIRKARAELKEQLKSGKTTLTMVLDRAESDEIVGKLKVLAVLQAMPGIGKVKATQIMEKLKIAESRRLRGLGDQQRKALLAEFTPASR